VKAITVSSIRDPAKDPHPHETGSDLIALVRQAGRVAEEEARRHG
jgi:hypothetical protein